MTADVFLKEHVNKTYEDRASLPKTSRPVSFHYVLPCEMELGRQEKLTTRK